MLGSYSAIYGTMEVYTDVYTYLFMVIHGIFMG